MAVEIKRLGSGKYQTAVHNLHIIVTDADMETALRQLLLELSFLEKRADKHVRAYNLEVQDNKRVVLDLLGMVGLTEEDDGI